MQMEIIGLFFPAVISVWIKHMINKEAAWSVPKVLFEYAMYVLVNVFITACTVTYGLGLSGVSSDALNSFPFFTKYTFIASVAAIIVPYAEEIVRKYIKVTLSVRTYDEKGNNNMEDC